jgi:transcriptional regulator with XRE-family HTH domain
VLSGIVSIMPKQPTISDRLRQAIKDNGPCLPLAYKAGVSATGLSRFMRGERSITLRVADRVCLALGLDLKK